MSSTKKPATPKKSPAKFQPPDRTSKPEWAVISARAWTKLVKDLGPTPTKAQFNKAIDALLAKADAARGKTPSKPKVRKTPKIENATGRPTLFTEERISVFLSSIASGKTEYYSANKAGWSESAYNKYKQRAVEEATAGETEESSAFVRLFTVSLAQAREEFVNQCLEEIKVIAATDNDWRAWDKLLERAEPERFGRKQVTLSGDKKNPVEVNVTTTLQAELGNLSPEQKVAYLKSFAAVLEGEPAAETKS